MNAIQGLYRSLMSKLEGLVRSLLEAKLASAEDVWNLEVSLVKYQLALSEAMSEETRAAQELKDETDLILSSRVDGWKQRVGDLQTKVGDLRKRHEVYNYALGVSCRFGDALAWVLLRQDENVLHSLSDNVPHGTVPRGVGLDGMLYAAQLLSNEGAGFPIIHDMTSALRIGDLTFVHPEHGTLTVEVKTHIIGHDESAGTTQYHIETVGPYGPDTEQIWASIDMGVNKTPLDLGVTSKLPKIKRRPKNTQFTRQLQRIGNARAMQVAVPNKLFRIPHPEVFGSTDRILSITSSLNRDDYHWASLQKLIKETSE